MKKLTSKAKYRDFVNSRDKALEGFLLLSRVKAGDVLRKFIQQVHQEVTLIYPYLNQEFLDPMTQNRINVMAGAIDRHAYHASMEITEYWVALRRRALLLTNAGEQQAVINATGGDPKLVTLTDEELYGKTELGPVFDRCYLAFSRLKRDVIDAVEMSRIMGDGIHGCMDRVMRVFPNAETVKKPPRPIRRVKREADVKPGDNKKLVVQDFLTKEEYEDIIDEYKATFVPKHRDPRAGQLESPVSIGTDEEYVIYPWQLEHEMTEDFVDRVMKGSHDGAKKQGITDFVWIAILDDRTDECCRKRDGLTVTEIKDKLSTSWKSDKCRAPVPPAHFNCRCRLAPATENLPERPESNEAEFEEWLNS